MPTTTEKRERHRVLIDIPADLHDRVNRNRSKEFDEAFATFVRAALTRECDRREKGGGK